ncbi:MAG: hypothetical protein WDO12_09715 [Pseudomonadota bacterium]
MKLKTRVKAGRITQNHNVAVKVKTRLKAGRISFNHNVTVR